MSASILDKKSDLSFIEQELFGIFGQFLATEWIVRDAYRIAAWSR
jgi:hypothetical protein